MPCFVGGDEEMRGILFLFFPFFFLLLVFPPGLRRTLQISLRFRQSQFHLHFATYGAALPPTRLSPRAQKATFSIYSARAITRFIKN